MVYYELDCCPECGLDFYPADDMSENDAGPLRAKSWGTSLSAIIVGWLASGMTTFALLYLSWTVFPGVVEGQTQSLAFAAIAAFVGGYIANVMTRRLPVLQGILVAVLSIVNVVLLETLWRNNTVETVVRPMTLLAWGLIIVGGVAGAVISMQLKLRAARSQPQAMSENDLYQDLLARVRHDRGVADRLIAFERQRAPTAGRIELIKNAIARWEHDNR